MAGLLSSSDVISFSGLAQPHWETFVRPITIHKEPEKIITVINNVVYPGYEGESTQENVTYNPRNQIFSGIVIYNNEQSTAQLTNIQSSFSEGKVRIKVQKDCHDYISVDRTLSVEVDSKQFNQLSDARVQNYLGLTYYIYFLDVAN